MRPDLVKSVDGERVNRHVFLMMLFALALTLAVQDASPAARPAAPAQLSSVEATNSSNFEFLGTRLQAAGDDIRIEGTVCRRANRNLISPTRVQIDHMPATGDPVETSYAYLPRLSQREDQRCGHFGTKLKSTPQPGDTYRVCLARSKGVCSVAK